MTAAEKKLSFKLETDLFFKSAFISAMRDKGGPDVPEEYVEMCWDDFSRGILQSMWTWETESVIEHIPMYAEDYCSNVVMEMNEDGEVRYLPVRSC